MYWTSQQSNTIHRIDTWLANRLHPALLQFIIIRLWNPASVHDEKSSSLISALAEAKWARTYFGDFLGVIDHDGSVVTTATPKVTHPAFRKRGSTRQPRPTAVRSKNLLVGQPQNGTITSTRLNPPNALLYSIKPGMTDLPQSGFSPRKVIALLVSRTQRSMTHSKSFSRRRQKPGALSMACSGRS